MSRPILLIAILILLMPMALAAFPMDNLQMAWTFDNDPNGTAIDANNSINGSAHLMTYTTGKNGQGVYFGQLPSGAYTGSHINMTSAITTTKTICLWIQPFKEFTNASSGTAGFMTAQVGSVIDKSFVFGGWDGSITGEIITFTDVVNTHLWYWDHQALTTTGSNSTYHHLCIVDNDDINNITMWYDGANIGQAKTKGGPATPLSGLQLVFGEDGVGDGYLGGLDEVYFWSDALNSSEIAELYSGVYYGEGGAPPTTPTGAVTGAGEQATEYAIVLMAMLLMVGLVMAVVPMASMGPMMKKVVIGTALAVLIVLILITIL